MEQHSQDKRSRANEKGALILPLLSCGKHISEPLRTRSFCQRHWCWVRDRLYLSAGINVHCPWWYLEDVYLPCSSLMFRHWVAKRLSSMLRARNIMKSCLWEIVQGWLWNQRLFLNA